MSVISSILFSNTKETYSSELKYQEIKDREFLYGQYLYSKRSDEKISSDVRSSFQQLKTVC